jgi:hypothetical protein
MAEEQINYPDVRQHLTSDQIEMLNAQLQAAVQKVIALSQHSEHLLNAVQEHYSAASLGPKLSHLLLFLTKHL